MLALYSSMACCLAEPRGYPMRPSFIRTFLSVNNNILFVAIALPPILNPELVFLGLTVFFLDA